MLTALDHVIIGVNDLAQATSVFSEKIGLVPRGGGTHHSGGTANRIILIGDTYLELITVQRPAEAQQSMRDRLAKGDGYLNFALSSNDIESDTRDMVQRGVSVIGPIPGQLKASNGQTRHDSTGEERRFRLAGWTEPPPHPLGAVQILSVTIAVSNLAEATSRFERIYGLTPSAPFTGDADDWEAMLVAFPIDESGQSFELAEPLPLSTTDTDIPTRLLPEPGALSQHLQTFGESLCRMSLAVENMDAARRYLDEHAVTYMYQEQPHLSLWIHPDQACGAAIVLHEITS